MKKNDFERMMLWLNIAGMVVAVTMGQDWPSILLVAISGLNIARYIDEHSESKNDKIGNKSAHMPEDDVVADDRPE